MCLLASNCLLILMVSFLYASNLREESKAILNAFLNNEETLLVFAGVNGRMGADIVEQPKFNSRKLKRRWF